MDFRSIRAITLDLDDTLWPVAPTIAAAEQRLREWLVEHAPLTASAFDAERMRALRLAVEREHPELAHDLSLLRLKTLERAIAQAGEASTLAQAAFDVFFDARQRVEFFPEVRSALQRLAARYPLYSLSNGNADLARVGLSGLFSGSISAREIGCAKPDPRIFAAACRRLGLEPAQVLHVGDDLELDVRGARAAGMATAWVRRAGASVVVDAVDEGPVVVDLEELVRQLGC